MYWSMENVPWTNMHDLNLDWIVNTMKQTVEQWIAYRIEMNQNYANFTEQINNDFDDFTEQINSDFTDFTTQINTWKTLIETEFDDLQTYVQNYFDNLDLNESTRYVINRMIESGEFIQVLNPSIVSATEAWLASHVTPTSPVLDDTLTISGAAADAKAAGNRITPLEGAVNNLYIIKRVFLTESGTISLQNGNLDPTTGGSVSNNKRVRSVGTLLPRKSFRTIVDDNYLCAPFFYGNFDALTETFRGYLPYPDVSDYVFTCDFSNYKGVKFVFKRKDNAIITEADKTAIANSFTLLYNTDESLAVPYSAADAASVGKRFDDLHDIYTESYGFEFGGVNRATGELAENTIRARSMLIPITENSANTELKFSCNVSLENYIFSGIVFYKDGVFVESKTTGYDPELSVYELDGTFNQFRVSFAKPDDADFTQEEIDSFALETIVKLDFLGLKKDIDNTKYPFKDMKYAALGDSITYGYIPRNYTGWPGQLNSFAKLTAEKLGMKFYNYGISGSTLAYHQSRDPMSRRFNSLPNNADLITVMGGTNDIRNGIQLGEMSDRTDATYYGALHVVLGGLYKKYMIDQGTTLGKKKHIVAITPIKLLAESASQQGGTGTLVDFEPWVEAVKEVAAYYSIPCFDAYNLSGLNPHLNETIHGWQDGYTGYYNPYITDGTHPTQEGAEIMANAFCAFLNTIM